MSITEVNCLVALFSALLLSSSCSSERPAEGPVEPSAEGAGGDGSGVASGGDDSSGAGGEASAGPPKAYVYSPPDLGASVQFVEVDGVRMRIVGDDAAGCDAAVEVPMTEGEYRNIVQIRYTVSSFEGSTTRTETTTTSYDEYEHGCNRLVLDRAGCHRDMCIYVDNRPLPAAESSSSATAGAGGGV